MAVEVPQDLAKILEDLQILDDTPKGKEIWRRVHEEENTLTILAQDIIREHGVQKTFKGLNQYNHPIETNYKETPGIKLYVDGQEVSLSLTEVTGGAYQFIYSLGVSSPSFHEPKKLFTFRLHHGDKKLGDVINSRNEVTRSSDLELAGSLLSIMQTQLRTPVAA